MILNLGCRNLCVRNRTALGTDCALSACVIAIDILALLVRDSSVGGLNADEWVCTRHSNVYRFTQRLIDEFFYYSEQCFSLR